MKISALDEYGLRCLIRLGRCPDGGSLTINEIAEGEGMSSANVRKLMMLLREAGFVQSVRGRSGGYAIRGRTDQITVGRVVEALGGRIFDDSFCGKHTGELQLCINTGACSVKSLWGVLDGLISGVLHRIRLSDLIGSGAPVSLSLKTHIEAAVDDLLKPDSPDVRKLLPLADVLSVHNSVMTLKEK